MTEALAQPGKEWRLRRYQLSRHRAETLGRDGASFAMTRGEVLKPVEKDLAIHGEAVAGSPGASSPGVASQACRLEPSAGDASTGSRDMHIGRPSPCPSRVGTGAMEQGRFRSSIGIREGRA